MYICISKNINKPACKKASLEATAAITVRLSCCRLHPSCLRVLLTSSQLNAAGFVLGWKIFDRLCSEFSKPLVSSMGVVVLLYTKHVHNIIIE